MGYTGGTKEWKVVSTWEDKEAFIEEEVVEQSFEDE